jgi:hypothetical protein
VEVQPQIAPHAGIALVNRVVDTRDSHVAGEHRDEVASPTKALDDVETRELIAAEVMRRVHVRDHEHSRH